MGPHCALRQPASFKVGKEKKNASCRVQRSLLQRAMKKFPKPSVVTALGLQIPHFHFVGTASVENLSAVLQSAS